MENVLIYGMLDLIELNQELGVHVVEFLKAAGGISGVENKRKLSLKERLFSTLYKLL